MRAETARELAEPVHAELVGHCELPADDVEVVTGLVQRRHPLLTTPEVNQVVAEVIARVAGLGPLEPFRADPLVTEIMVSAPGPVWIERCGELEQTSVTLEVHTLEHLIERVIAPLGLQISRSSPVVDARLPDGSRVHAVVPPVAVDGPTLTIRRFAAEPWRLADLCAGPLEALLARAVTDRQNIVVFGGTGAGKTTLLNAMSAHIGQAERLVTIEETAELRLDHCHVVRLEARHPNAEGVGGVDIRYLVRTALRMRPDRIIVGEVRGPEALDMLQAMNTGHAGSMSTCHANSARDALRRLETMVLMADVGLPASAIRDQLASTVDLLVEVRRLQDGRRQVSAAHAVERGSASEPEVIRLDVDGRGDASDGRSTTRGASHS